MAKGEKIMDKTEKQRIGFGLICLGVIWFFAFIVLLFIMQPEEPYGTGSSLLLIALWWIPSYTLYRHGIEIIKKEMGM